MLMPALSSRTSSSSSSSATVRVEKATSEFLIGPDWTMNMDICDAINSDHRLAKDIIKAVKKRLQHKSPKVQLLVLTLLETMVKNCGEFVHLLIAEKNILQEMIKIVKKMTDIHVRDKILVLLDSWQEAFGGPGGRYPQYYWAYEELRRSGVNFPQRSSNSAPIFTPPATHPIPHHAQPGYGMPSNSSTRLDEVMAAEIGNFSLANIDPMRNILDLLADMLQAVDPSDRLAVKDDLIVDLVQQCRLNQKKLMQMLTTTTNEEHLAQGLELNDSLQNVLAKHDAIACGSPLPITLENVGIQSEQANVTINKPSEPVVHSPTLASNPFVPAAGMGIQDSEEEEKEEDDDFAQLARRHHKNHSSATVSVPVGSNEHDMSVTTSSSSTSAPMAPVLGNELALPDPPTSVRTSKDQDMIDLLTLALSTTTTSPSTPPTPPTSSQYVHPPVSPVAQSYSTSFLYPGNERQVPGNNYVVPWAQPLPQQASQAQQQTIPPPQYPPQSQLQHQPHSHYPSYSFQHQPQLQFQPQPQPQPQSHLQNQHQKQPQSQSQPQTQPQFSQYSSGYPPPPWAPTPGYLHHSPAPHTHSSAQASTSRPLQHFDLIPQSGSNGLSIGGDARPNSAFTPIARGHKPFVPSYRLFEDLNVLRNADGKYKATSNTSSSLSGTNKPNLVSGRK